MPYLDNPALDTVRADWPGHPFERGRFGYPELPDFRPEWGPVFRMLFSRNPRRAEKRADAWMPAVSADTAYLADRSRDWLVWLGHAVFLLQLDGKRYLTDPVLYDLPFLPRRVPLPFAVEQLTGIDYVLLSHDHRDHCDKKSLRRVLQHNPAAKILTALRMRTVIGGWTDGVVVEEAGWYQRYRTAGPEVLYLPARHWCRRGVLDFNRRLWGSFLIRGKNKTIYFGADSGYGPHFAQLGQRFPGIDVAIIGIGAYQPRYLMAPMHADPAGGLQAFRDLGARTLVPMHYGTYDLSREPPGDPERVIKRLFEGADMTDRLCLPGINRPVDLSINRPGSE